MSGWVRRSKDLSLAIVPGVVARRCRATSAPWLSRSWFGSLWACVIAGFALLPACAAQAADAPNGPSARHPLNYLQSFGSPGHEIRAILVALGWLSIVVVVIITALVVIAIVRRGRQVEDMSADEDSVTAGQDAGALRWIYGGLAATVVILLVFVAWTVSIMVTIQSPGEGPVATIEVTGHQWWWEVAYKDDDGTTLFETANEIHVPVGRSVRFVLRSDDVIHSFWVPQLGGKMDMIPGQDNVTWLRADTAGVYRGQCVEYCGLQHANMAFDLVAVPPAEFDAWLARRARTARQTATAPGAPRSNSMTR